MYQDCVPGAVPATVLLTATLTDYNGNQIGETQRSVTSGVTAPFDWKPTFGPVNLPSTPGNYTYTLHYYRQTDIPPNPTMEIVSPDVYCNQTYGLRNCDPVNGGYTEEYCYDNNSLTFTVGAGCPSSEDSLSQDGKGNADARGTVSCLLLPSDAISQGQLVFDDWSGQPVPGYEPYVTNGGGFRTCGRYGSRSVSEWPTTSSAVRVERDI
jgi:hypothetical protein